MECSFAKVCAACLMFILIGTERVHASCNIVTDPCGLSNYSEIPYLEQRSPNTTLTTKLIDNKYCDLYALNEDTWYRSEYNMTNYCVAQQACGADNPIWMQGDVPGVDDGVVTRTTCVRSYLECCAVNYTVMMKNCETFSVYCFVDTPTACHQRFCFDSNGITTTTTTESTTTSIQNGNQDSNKKKCNNDGPSTPITVVITVVVCMILFSLVVVVILGIRHMRKRPDCIHPDSFKRASHYDTAVTVNVKEAPEYVSF